MTGFDYSSTAVRPLCTGLPPEVLDALELALGGPPDSVQSAGGGFTPGFAATFRRGSRAIFVKAASSANAFPYSAYAREASVLAGLPEGLRGLPPLLADGSMLDGLLDDDAVSGIFARCARGERIAFLPPLPSRRWLELQSLVEQAPVVLAGSSVLHNDLRPDNIILASGSGRAWVCDWNHLTKGPAWADWVGLLPYARQGGLDADTLLRDSALSGGVPNDAVDSWLAVLAAYMVVTGSSPEVPTSPHLRAHGRFTARIMVDWVSERRKWAA
ncbi:phosphotransferase [Arthrobacter echini]|uniref:Phosphotransferase n=1 Tax=Arthrobacter echini TaxID=1529066 RepID=A0A5D0XM01_9MICC|nr:phosphotransferase [Arthrobacter echini]TYC97463.1 phosphotransferase [Arthrobacter echini]